MLRIVPAIIGTGFQFYLSVSVLDPIEYSMYGCELIDDSLRVKISFCTAHVKAFEKVLQPFVACFGTRNTLDSRDRSLPSFQLVSEEFDMLKLLTLRKSFSPISLLSLLKSGLIKLVQRLFKMTGSTIHGYETPQTLFTDNTNLQFIVSRASPEIALMPLIASTNV